MKRKVFIVSCLLIFIILLIIFVGCLIKKNVYIKNCREIRLHSSYCEKLFELTPEEFCESKGKNTILEDGYASAKVDEAGYLILKMSDVQIQDWRNSRSDMRVLQAVLGNGRNIGVSIIAEEDPINAAFIQYADTCGFDISEDYKLIQISSDDDVLYLSTIVSSCLFMQVTNEIPSDETIVEYICYDENGEITKRDTLSLKDVAP